MPHPLGINKLPANPIKKFTVSEVRVAINKLRSTKAPGYDLITGEILKKLPKVGLSANTYIYNSILCIPWQVESISNCHNTQTWQTCRRCKVLQTNQSTSNPL